MEGNGQTNGLPPTPENTGGAGGMCTDFRSLRSDSRLAARMLSLGVVSEETAAKLIRRGFAMAAKSRVPRNYKAAMSVPLAMVALEQKERLGLPDTGGQTVNVNVGVAVETVRQELVNDAKYLEYLRQSADISDASPVCENGEPGALENGQSSNGAGPGHNGHADGNGRH